MATAITVPAALAKVLAMRGIQITNGSDTATGVIPASSPSPETTPFSNEAGMLPILVEAVKELSTAQALVTTIGQLPAAASSKGKRAMVTDANLGLLGLGGVFGNTLTAGGSTTVPVWCDGSSWRIG